MQRVRFIFAVLARADRRNEVPAPFCQEERKKARFSQLERLLEGSRTDPIGPSCAGYVFQSPRDVCVKLWKSPQLRIWAIARSRLPMIETVCKAFILTTRTRKN